MRHGGEVGAQHIPALRLLRRGLAASPELRKGAALTLALAMVAGGGRVVTPVLVQQTIDRHVTGDTARLQGMLLLAGTGLALILVAAWAARTTSQRLATASERALCGLRVRAFNHIHALSMAHHTEEQRGALVSRVTSDVETLGQFFRWGGLAWVINSALMLAALAAMLVYDWRLALIAVATVLPLVAVLRVMQRRVVVAWDAVRTRVGESLAAISESIQGAAVIRAYGVQAPAQRRVLRTVEARRQAEIRAGTIGAFFFPSGELFGVLATAAVLLAGMAIGPEGGLTAGTLVAFAFLVTIFLEPVAEFTEILDMTQQAVAGWKKVLDVLDTPVEVEDPRPGLTLPARALDIELDRVSFAYHGGPPVLVDVHVTIPAGTRVALVGTTGSGKTTLAKLLIRLADPTAGTIRVAGVGLRQVSLASLRSALVMVPQDGFLFDTSVAENVRMGRPDAGDREVRAAFEALELGRWVDGLPRGIHTRVGERGDYLSVGERQLVALARGYLADPGCLILDEATSAVDPATEVALRNAIQRLTEGRTALTIAHRLATAEHADLILVLERGRLVEQGTHAQLLADPGGAYARLHGSWIASLAAGGEPAGRW
ncbi:MAG TPA: ABC transporter ATP-binding protein [Actinomycetota bacterium]|jgi:ATP-binding cassette subfamily B protein|nr:ABC transporter ATP-binding protein [Actinomycetota bacterium]